MEKCENCQALEEKLKAVEAERDSAQFNKELASDSAKSFKDLYEDCFRQKTVLESQVKTLTHELEELRRMQ